MTPRYRSAAVEAKRWVDNAPNRSMASAERAWIALWTTEASKSRRRAFSIEPFAQNLSVNQDQRMPTHASSIMTTAAASLGSTCCFPANTVESTIWMSCTLPSRPFRS